MTHLKVTIECNGTEQEVIASLKDMLESFETCGVLDVKETWITVKVDETNN